jgi:rod shape-determining protein MreD
MIGDVLKAAVIVCVAAVVQVSFVNAFELAEGRAGILLLVIVSIALLRGPLFGTCAGFAAGLIVDVATLGTLGLTSLLLTIAGYWAGRLGDATSNHENQRARILLAVALLTVGVEIGSLIVHVLLGESASLGGTIWRVLAPTLALNLALAIPAYALCRRLFPPPVRRREAALV